MSDDAPPAADSPERAAGDAPDPARSGDGDRLAAIVAQARLSVARRVFILRAVTDTLAAGPLDDGRRAVAKHEAHTLVGTAGTFGLTRISELASELEELLYRWADDEPDHSRAGQLVRQMTEALPPDSPDLDRDAPGPSDSPAARLPEPASPAQCCDRSRVQTETTPN